MRRLWAALVVTVIAATPAMQLYCLVSCTQDEAAAPGGCGHEAATVPDAPAFQSAQDCGDHPAPTAIVALSPKPTVELLILTLAPIVIAAATLTASEMAMVSGLRPPRGPSGPLHVPLRV